MQKNKKQVIRKSTNLSKKQLKELSGKLKKVMPYEKLLTMMHAYGL